MKLSNRVITIAFIVWTIGISLIVRHYFPKTVTAFEETVTIDDFEVKRLTTELREATLLIDELKNLPPEYIPIEIPATDSIPARIDTIKVYLVARDTLIDISDICFLAPEGDSISFTFEKQIITDVKADSLKERLFLQYSIVDSIKNFSLVKVPINIVSEYQFYIGAGFEIEAYQKIENDIIKSDLSGQLKIPISYIAKEKYSVTGTFDFFGSEKSVELLFMYRIK